MPHEWGLRQALPKPRPGSWNSSGARPPRVLRCRRGCLRSERLASSIEPEQVIDADRSRSARREVEKDEAEEHRGLAMVLDGPEAAREMADEVRERHLARGDEGCRPSQEAQEDECAAHELDHARGHEERRHLD